MLHLPSKAFKAPPTHVSQPSSPAGSTRARGTWGGHGAAPTAPAGMGPAPTAPRGPHPRPYLQPGPADPCPGPAGAALPPAPSRAALESRGQGRDRPGGPGEEPAPARKPAPEEKCGESPGARDGGTDAISNVITILNTTVLLLLLGVLAVLFCYWIALATSAAIVTISLPLPILDS